MTNPSADEDIGELLLDAAEYRRSYVALNGEPTTGTILMGRLAAALTRLQQELALLRDPAAVRVNILRGTIVIPDDLVWLHDTNGPVATAVAAEREACAQIADKFSKARAEEASEDYINGTRSAARRIAAAIRARKPSP